ncbi:EAL domain-containing protein [Escherichia coli]|nr:EAL domain-containing protein [Escherichia coli]
MEVIYIAEPIISTNTNKLIVVELLSRFYSKTGVPLSTQRVLSTFTTTMKINLLKSQIKAIISHRDFLNVMKHCALLMLITKPAYILVVTMKFKK